MNAIPTQTPRLSEYTTVTMATATTASAIRRCLRVFDQATSSQGSRMVRESPQAFV